MNMDLGLEGKYNRLRNLLGAGNVDAPHIQTEIVDLRRDILGSGHTEVDIVARTDPRRFEAGFDPADPDAVVSAKEGETHVVED
jgi:hypothetical protein